MPRLHPSLSVLKPVTGLLCLAFAVMAATPAEAKKPHRAKQSTQKKAAKSTGPANPGASIVIDAFSGKVLFPDADKGHYNDSREPASLTKMMTAMVVFDAIRAKKLRYSDRLPLADAASDEKDGAVSLHRKYGFKVGTSLTVDNLLSAVAVTSAADATITFSNALCHTDTCIADLMNKKLETIFKDEKGYITHFANAHGMPDSTQKTTAKEQALILRYLVNNYESEYGYFGQTSYKINGMVLKGHNHLLVDYNRQSKLNPFSCTMEGGKTGYFRAAKSNLAASAICEGYRVIAVRLMAPNAPTRDREVAALFNEGFKILRDKNAPQDIPLSKRIHTPAILKSVPELEREADAENTPELPAPTPTLLPTPAVTPQKVSPTGP